MATKLPTQLLTTALRRAAPAPGSAPANTFSTSARRLSAGATGSQTASSASGLTRMWQNKNTRPYVVGGVLAMAAADVTLYYRYGPSFWSYVNGEDKN